MTSTDEPFNCFKHRLLSGTNCMGTCLILMVLVNIGAVIALLLILSNDVEFNPGPDKHKPFKIGHNNIRGLRSNFVDLKVMLSSMFDLFCISETMLSSHVDNSTIRIPGYQMLLHQDRDHNGVFSSIYPTTSLPRGVLTWSHQPLKPYG